MVQVSCQTRVADPNLQPFFCQESLQQAYGELGIGSSKGAGVGPTYPAQWMSRRVVTRCRAASSVTNNGVAKTGPFGLNMPWIFPFLTCFNQIYKSMLMVNDHAKLAQSTFT